jgi:hypothetical protein
VGEIHVHEFRGLDGLFDGLRLFREDAAPTTYSLGPRR